MISLEECKKILNSSKQKYTAKEIKLIRDLLTKIAKFDIEFCTSKEQIKTNNKLIRGEK